MPQLDFVLNSAEVLSELQCEIPSHIGATLMTSSLTEVWRLLQHTVILL